MTRRDSEGPLVIAGTAVGRGVRQVIKLPVTTGLSGGEIAVWVHAVRGKQPGPILVLLSGMHGDEWFVIEAMRQLLMGFDPATLRGTVLAVPVVNGPALAQLMRNMPDNCDSPDMNRLFPGPLSATSDQIVKTVSVEVLSHATHLLDFHIGPWGSAFRDLLVAGDAPDPAVTAESERLALVLGAPVVRSANVMTGFPGPRSTLGYGAGILQIPTIGVEIGGSGFAAEIEHGWRQEIVAGVGALMAEIGMVDGAADHRRRQLVYRRHHRVNPSVGGLLRPAIGPDRLSTTTEQGELLGEVISPYTLDVLEELRAPVSGILTYVAREYPVNPGAWGYGIAVADGEGARWIVNGNSE